MARTSKNNVAANTAAAKNQKPKATAPIQEAMFTMEEVENLMAEKGLSFEPIDDNHGALKKGNKVVLKFRVIEKAPAKKSGKKAEQQSTEDKPKQVHIARDRDNKLESTKVGEFGVKIIYHRMKDNSKQYRIFIAYKADGKLVRNRLVNEDIKKVESDEKKALEYFHRITKSEATLKKVI